jgi:CSLREA domain-containing protein
MRSFNLFALAAALAAAPVHATMFNVNSEADVPDDSVGDGTCHAVLGLPGVCTLRAAVQEANAHAGADTISLSAGQVYTLTRNGQDDSALNGDLDIDDNVTILFFASGERPVVDANGLERAFEIHSGNVTMFGFDITGGDATLALDAAGGGIAINFDAGAVQLSLMRIHGNRANFGGGLYNDGANTTLSASEVFDNEQADGGAGFTGGGIRNRGTLRIEYSSVYANHGEGELGTVAVSNEAPNTGSASMTVVNSTIASNVGVGLESASDGAEHEASLALRNATIGGNSATGLRIAGSAGAYSSRNSVVASNAGADCQVSSSALLDLDLDHYNVDSDDSCEFGDGASNATGIDTQLTPLDRRGGLTMVSWPLTTSPLIEFGPAIGCEDDDQQFGDRPIDFDGNGNSRCDIGAIELQSDVIFFEPFDRL